MKYKIYLFKVTLLGANTKTQKVRLSLNLRFILLFFNNHRLFGHNCPNNIVKHVQKSRIRNKKSNQKDIRKVDLGYFS